MPRTLAKLDPRKERADECTHAPRWPDEYQSRRMERYHFRLHDEQGRELGVEVSFYQVTLESLPPEGSPRGPQFSRAPGTYYVFAPQALRDGQPFGCNPHETWCLTESARTVAVERYIAGARKRLLKRRAESPRASRVGEVTLTSR